MFLETVINMFDLHEDQPWAAIGSCMQSTISRLKNMHLKIIDVKKNMLQFSMYKV